MEILLQTERAVAYSDTCTMPDGVKLSVTIIKPSHADKCPIVLYRTPYDAPEKRLEMARSYAESRWMDEGFAIVRQDVRGKGLSEGICEPYENERADGLVTHDYVRALPFYCGEIYLAGRSYLSTVHLSCATAFGDDIKAAALDIQTDRMYFRNFRNGCSYRIGNVEWWLKMLRRRYPDQTREGIYRRPFIDVMRRAIGENLPYYEATLENTEYNSFWQSDPRTYASESLKIPVLFTEGWYDFYIDGMYDMWSRLPEETRRKSAMVIGPWGHNTAVSRNAEHPLPSGNRSEDHALE
ncbi:MAG: CocE/NonD family hydrolase, partial [Ruminococcaceae bacterium]|nr:CocE/NonD family hydrolase [Oscillospiraceae bacterium]